MWRALPLLLLALAAASLSAPAGAQAAPQASCSPSSCPTWQRGPVTVNWTDSTPGQDPSSCPSFVSDETLLGDLPLGTPVTCDDGDASGPVTIYVRIDKTPPHDVSVSPAPDGAHGWYTQPVDLTLSAVDDLSGIDSCDSPHYAGPSGASIDVGGCRDNAGNTAHAFIKYDDSPPAVQAQTSRAPDSGGWFNHPLDVSFNGTDPTSGIDSCDGPVSVSAETPPGGTNFSGSCTNMAGLSASGAVRVYYDATPPAGVTGAPDRAPDQAGWYNHPLGLAFSSTGDALSGLAGCDTVTYFGPDGHGVSGSGGCRDVAGNVGSASSAPFNYDATPPVISGATADRPPDHDGWYNHPISFTFAATDATSGLASCDTVSYSGPDSAHARLTGTCSDVAGNVASASRTIKYDATPPGPPLVQTTPGNHRIELFWIAPPDATSFAVARSIVGGSAPPKLVYSGSGSSFMDKGLSNGVKYSYAVVALDQAGNPSAQIVRAIPTASSLRPFVGTSVSGPLALSWKRVKAASYYNVQLYRGKKKVLSAWPRAAALQLGSHWHYRGATRELLPGHYRWYVWPGFGPLGAHRYGKLIGQSSFRVTPTT